MISGAITKSAFACTALTSWVEVPVVGTRAKCYGMLDRTNCRCFSGGGDKFLKSEPIGQTGVDKGATSVNHVTAIRPVMEGICSMIGDHLCNRDDLIEPIYQLRH